jgi:hypothetical protein
MVLLVVHGSPLQSQRETLEFGIDGAALDRSRDVGSQKRLSQIESLQTTSHPPCRSHRST